MARRVRTAALLLGLGLAAGCATGTTTRRCEVTRGPDDPSGALRTLTYADGSGNAYLLKGAQLEYLPVTPESSSSGTYSGGRPFTKTLANAELAEFSRALDAGIAAKDSHIQQRVLMSGQITLECAGGETRHVILQPGCAEQKAVEELLARLKSR